MKKNIVEVLRKWLIFVSITPLMAAAFLGYHYGLNTMIWGSVIMLVVLIAASQYIAKLFIKPIDLLESEKNRYEQELHLEKIKYQQLLDCSIDGIHIVNAKGYIIEANEAFANSLGYSLIEIIGMHVSEWDEDAVLKDKDIVNTLLEEPRTFNTIHKRKDGSVFPAQVNIQAITLNGEKVLYASSKKIP